MRNCGRERERGEELYSVAGGLIMGGMEECTVGVGVGGGGRQPAYESVQEKSLGLANLRRGDTAILPASKSCAT